MKSIFRIAKSIAALALAILAAPRAEALTVTTTAGNGSISLAWTAEAGATAYRVEHATTSGGPYAELASGLAATTYTHTGVASGGTNYYVVTASTPGGDVASAGDTVLVGAGTYAITAAVTLTNAISLIGVDGPSATTIQANNCRGVHVTATGAGALVAGFTVTGGNAAYNKGANIYLQGAGTVSNCVAKACQAWQWANGGGIAADAGLVTHCVVHGNRVDNRSGAALHPPARTPVRTSPGWRAPAIWPAIRACSPASWTWAPTSASKAPPS